MCLEISVLLISGYFSWYWARFSSIHKNMALTGLLDLAVYKIFNLLPKSFKSSTQQSVLLFKSHANWNMGVLFSTSKWMPWVIGRCTSFLLKLHFWFFLPARLSFNFWAFWDFLKILDFWHNYICPVSPTLTGKNMIDELYTLLDVPLVNLKCLFWQLLSHFSCVCSSRPFPQLFPFLLVTAFLSTFDTVLCTLQLSG